MARSNVAVFVRMASRPVPRVQRGMSVAKELGLDPVFCGAMRQEGLVRSGEWAGFPLVRIGPTFPLLNGRRLFLYLRSVTLFQLALIRYLFRTRPGLVHASDVETVVACIVYAKLKRVRLLYNVHDNLSQRYNLPRFFQSILNTLEGILILFADVALVPERFRRDALPSWCRHKIVVVRNTPQDVEYSPPRISVGGKIRIFYGGWLDWGRGLKEMVELANANPAFELRVAGEGAQDIIDYLKSQKCVEYLGILEYQECLEETRNCHFVPAFYRPSTIINRYAASNKLAEALAIGRPLLLNDEMKITELFGRSPAVFSRPFDRLNEVADDIVALFRDLEKYMAASAASRDLYEKFYKWETSHEKMLAVFGDSIAL